MIAILERLPFVPDPAQGDHLPAWVWLVLLGVAAAILLWPSRRGPR